MNSVNERFRSIYDNYMPLLRVIAKRRGIPYDEIEDIVQETFASFYSHYAEALPNMTDEMVKRTLSTIIRNRCIDYFRRKSTHPVDYFDPVTIQEQRFGPNHDRDETLHILLENREYRDVMNALIKMKRDWAEIFLLLAIEERPVEEVSEQLGISKEACRTRLARARKHLRKELECYRPANVSEKKKALREKPRRISETPNPPGVPENA